MFSVAEVNLTEIEEDGSEADETVQLITHSLQVLQEDDGSTPLLLVSFGYFCSLNHIHMYYSLFDSMLDNCCRLHEGRSSAFGEIYTCCSYTWYFSVFSYSKFYLCRSFVYLF